MWLILLMCAAIWMQNAVAKPSLPPEILLKWQHTYRIISSHFPPIKLFEDLQVPDHLEELYYIESLTNDRLRDEVGDISLVAKEDRVVGAGASIVMSAFTHISKERISRFSDGSFGVYYASKTLETAIFETVYHRERFLSYTAQPPCELTM